MIQDISQVSHYYKMNNSIVEVYRNGVEVVIITASNNERLDEIIEALELRLKNYQKGK